MIINHIDYLYKLRIKIYLVLFFSFAILSVYKLELFIFSFLFNFFLIFLFFEGSIFLRRSIFYYNVKSFIIGLLFSSIIIRILFSTFIMLYFSYSYNDLLGFQPQDELGYYINAVQISKGNFENIIFNSDLGASLYYSIFAFFSNGNIFFMKIFNSIISALIPLQTFYISKYFLKTNDAKYSAILSVFFPCYLIHSGFLFKESIMLVLILFTIQCILRLKSKFSFKYIFLFLIGVSTLFLFRTIVALSLVITMSFYIYRNSGKFKYLIFVFNALFFYLTIIYSPFILEILSYIDLLFKGNIGGYLSYLLEIDGIIMVIGPIPQ